MQLDSLHGVFMVTFKTGDFCVTTVSKYKIHEMKLKASTINNNLIIPLKVQYMKIYLIFTIIMFSFRLSTVFIFNCFLRFTKHSRNKRRNYWKIYMTICVTFALIFIVLSSINYSQNKSLTTTLNWILKT